MDDDTPKYHILTTAHMVLSESWVTKTNPDFRKTCVPRFSYMAMAINWGIPHI